MRSGAAMLVVLAACSGGEAVLDRPDAQPSSSSDSGNEARFDASAPDAEADAGPEDGGRLRRRPLLGTLPIENRLYDPMMEISAYHWALDIIDGTTTELERLDRLRREAHPDVPTGAPVLHVKRGREGRILLATDGVGSGRPLDASVWIGRRIDTAGDPPRVSLVGLGSRGATVAIDLVATATVVARTSGVEWVRFEGRWDAAPIGQVLLTIEDPLSAVELFVSGPALVDAALGVRGVRGVGAAPHAARPREARPTDGRARRALARTREPRPSRPRALGPPVEPR